MKCNVTRLRKDSSGRLGLWGGGVIGTEVILECRNHLVYFGADAGKRLPKRCPITRIPRIKP